MTKPSWSGNSHCGLVREENEDAWIVRDYTTSGRGILAAVADGMGGVSGGRLASNTALAAFASSYETSPGSSPEDWLERAFAWASQSIAELACTNPDLGSMGTTLTAVALVADALWIASVGDSRAFRIRQGICVQLTCDDTVTERLIREGKLEAEEAATHPQKHVLTKVIGGATPLGAVIAKRIEVRAGDCIVLATDGLHGSVSGEEIARELDRCDVALGTKRLIELGLARGADDNLTIVCLCPLPPSQALQKTVPNPIYSFL